MAVLLFGAFATLAVLVKGHLILKILRNFIPPAISDGQMIGLLVGLIVTTTAAVLIWLMRQEYRDCDYQECLYCAKCDAVDKYDNGWCPVCQMPLKEKVVVYYTTYKDEKRLLERWGLPPSKEG